MVSASAYTGTTRAPNSVSVCGSTASKHRREQECHLALEHISGGAIGWICLFPDRLNVYGATAAGKFAGSDQHIARTRNDGRGSTRNDAGDQGDYLGRVLFARASTDKVCALLQ